MADLTPLADVMRRLRDPNGGCPWDIEQTFATIAPYTIEEAYEVADAIAQGDMGELCEELGDLLLQVVYHAQMAREAGHFTLDDVISGITDKMIRRHPHVFGDAVIADAAEQTRAWDALKAREKQRDSALSGVARALPAAKRAQKIQSRAARVGFDWPDAEGPRAKIMEELDEVSAANSHDAHVDEVGDLLFAVINYARHLGVDAEEALRGATDKFETRFRSMETASGPDFAALSLEEKERLWVAAKAATQR